MTGQMYIVYQKRMLEAQPMCLYLHYSVGGSWPVWLFKVSQFHSLIQQYNCFSNQGMQGESIVPVYINLILLCIKSKLSAISAFYVPSPMDMKSDLKDSIRRVFCLFFWLHCVKNRRQELNKFIWWQHADKFIFAFQLVDIWLKKMQIPSSIY